MGIENSTRWRGIDHVQLAIPVGAEDVARAFYEGVLGLAEVAKPPRKAHPALLITGLREFIEAADIEAHWSDEHVGSVRCHIDDPFGNRIELIEVGE